MRANNMLSLNNEEEEEDDDDDDERREKPESEWRDLVQKLREEKESQEAQYEEEFREFERMANEKVVQLEEYYVQQLQMKETYVQSLQQQLQTTLLSKTTNKEQQEVSVPVPVAGFIGGSIASLAPDSHADLRDSMIADQKPLPHSFI